MQHCNYILIFLDHHCHHWYLYIFVPCWAQCDSGRIRLLHSQLSGPAQALSAPVPTFVSNIKNVPAQNISGRHIYLSCRIHCCDGLITTKCIEIQLTMILSFAHFVNILFSKNRCVVIIVLGNSSFTILCKEI